MDVFIKKGVVAEPLLMALINLTVILKSVNSFAKTSFLWRLQHRAIIAFNGYVSCFGYRLVQYLRDSRIKALQSLKTKWKNKWGCWKTPGFLMDVSCVKTCNFRYIQSWVEQRIVFDQVVYYCKSILRN